MRLTKAVSLLALGSFCLLIFNMLYLRSTNKQEEDLQTNKLRSHIEKLFVKSQKQEENVVNLQKLVDLQKQGVHQTSSPVVPQQPNHVNVIADPVNLSEQHNEDVIPVLLFSCNRPKYVTQALDDLIKYRPNKEQFPIIVSQDCGHAETSDAIGKYKDQILLHIKQPDLSPIPNLTKKEKKQEGYYKIARHYKFGLQYVFRTLSYKAVIIVEDDLNVSPDFFGYFKSLLPLLYQDPSLFCVSAWNDNGKEGLIQPDPTLLYRSDFFPGLGWMMLSSLWDELEPKWPKGFWDDWLRGQEQRKERACIRPEISRTHTYGEKGTSLGLFYKQHLKFIVLNEERVDWDSKDFTYLIKENYDDDYVRRVYSYPSVELADITQQRVTDQDHVRVTYATNVTFKLIAKALKIMDDFKDGVPRTAYKGIVPIMHKSLRVYIAPPASWSGYDRTWK